MKKFLLISFVLLISISLLNCNKQENYEENNEDDEFSEFDSIDEEVPKQKLNTQTKTSQQHQQQQQQKASTQSDSDFVSFDDEDDNEESENYETQPKQQIKQPKQQQEKTTQKSKQDKKSFNSNLNDDLDMEEFEHFVDDEEFENFDTIQSSSTQKQTQSKKSQASSSSSSSSKDKETKSSEIPRLKIADVPKHLISNGNWMNYIYEIAMLVIIFIYFIFFLIGKSKNYRLVNSWYQANRDLLERNFSLVGDDGTSTEIPQQPEKELGTLIKESENSYGLWCSGRQGCDGLLVQLKLIKRQDLINGLLMQLIKPQSDQILFSVEYPNLDEIDSFVFCLTNKKQSQLMFNDYQDLSTYCVEKKIASLSTTSYSDLLTTQVANKYVLLNEIGEVPNYVMDKSICAFLNKYPDMVEYILISDQYTGVKSNYSEDQTTSPTNTETQVPTNVPQNSIGIPKSRSVLIVCFNVPGRGLHTSSEDFESMVPALQLALYLIDKVPRIRLSKEAKSKALKKRKDISEQYMKLNHKQRQEAAMLRKEEKRRAEKEKIMNESDPEKQKKLEEKELKKEKKKSLSKMKQIKIKSM